MKTSTLSLTHYGRRCLALLLTVLFFHAGAAFADFNAGVAALKNHDYPAAFAAFKQAAKDGDVRAYAALGKCYVFGRGTSRNATSALYWFRKGAAAGDADAMAQLGNLYLLGSGVPKNLDKARQWALRSAAKGNASGHLLIFLIFATQTALRQQNTHREMDMTHYTVLRQRPAAAHAAEINAYTHLAKAVEKGNAAALNTYLLYLGDKTAPGNDLRFLSIFYRMQQAHVPIMPRVKRVATVWQFMESKGASLASAGMFASIQLSAKAAILARYETMHAAFGTTKDKTCRNHVAPIRLEVTQPLQGAVWLPLKDRLFKQTYLLKGHWKEKWTYAICGKKMPMTISFSADGLGGAYFTGAIDPRPHPAANQPSGHPAKNQRVLVP